MTPPITVTLTLVSLFAAPLTAHAQACAPWRPDPMAGFTALDANMYLDLPDSETVRVTSTLENNLISNMMKGEANSVTKTWCQIGIQRFIVDFTVPVQDDAIAATVTRAVYVWNSNGDPIGWQLSQLGERSLCARGDDPFAPLCP